MTVTPKTVAKQPVIWIAIAVTAVAAFEGFSSKKYYDSVGVATICYGATASDGVDLSKAYTKAECMDMLGKDLVKYDTDVKRCLSAAAYSALGAHRHAALVSLDYNIGAGNFCRSNVARELNAGHVQKACDDFLAYNHAGGRVLAGLTTRREAERKMCLVSESGPAPAPAPTPAPEHPSFWQHVAQFFVNIWHWLSTH